MIIKIPSSFSPGKNIFAYNYIGAADIFIPGLVTLAAFKNRNVPNWFKGDDFQTAKEKYNAGIDWKREEHKKNNTTTN